MKVIINEKCSCSSECKEKDYFLLKTKLFNISFFEDFGTKFLCVRMGKKNFRWDW